jgi:hypothetical protein
MTIKTIKQQAESAITARGKEAEILFDAATILKLAEMCQRMEAILQTLVAYQWPLHPTVRETFEEWKEWKEEKHPF